MIFFSSTMVVIGEYYYKLVSINVRLFILSSETIKLSYPIIYYSFNSW